MEFSVDLKAITLDEFQQTLEGMDVPGRKVLKEDIPGRFQKLQDAGVKNLGDLISKINTDKKLETFAAKTGLPMDYLVILKRETNSYLPKALAFHQFPGVKPELIGTLQQKGIQNSRQLFEKAGSAAERAALAGKLSIDLKELTALAEMADLTRINGIGPIFALMLQKADVHTTQEFLDADKTDLLARLLKIKDEGRHTQVNITRKDLDYCMRFAKLLKNSLER